MIKTSKPLPEYVTRMAEEIKVLIPRLQNLSKFLENKTFDELSPLNRSLLQQQRDSMEEYAKTLSLRHIMAILDIEKE